MAAQDFLNESIYLAENPEIAGAVSNGAYPSAIEEFQQVGQLAERKGVVFEGTSGDDLIASAGQKSSVIGVKVLSATVGNRLINAETESFGAGERDTLLGSPGRNIFYLGDNATENPSDFYLGNGADDLATIRYFDPTSEDAVYLAGKAEDYSFETIDGSVNISKGEDLIGVVEGIPKLIPDGLFTENGLLLLAPQNSYYASRTQPYFNEPAYLAANPDVPALIESKEYTSGWDHFIKKGIDEDRQTFFNGKVGNDSFFYPLGNATVVSFPITEYDSATGAIKTATVGTGDKDHYHGSFGRDRFLLGNAGEDFYVGQGDKDYVLIGDFNPKEDQLIVAGDLADYKFDIYDDEYEGVIYKEFQISTKEGDVIARIEDAETLELVQIESEIPGTQAFVSTEYDGLPTTPMPPAPTPSSPLFGTAGNDILNIVEGNQLVFAGAGDDLIDLVQNPGGNRAYGSAGNDTFLVGQGDYLTGGEGSDRFFAQAGGDNELVGGAGADQFWIASGIVPASANRVSDFTATEDVIGIAGLGASFSQISLNQQDQDVMVIYNNSTLAALNGVQATSLSADNFVFV